MQNSVTNATLRSHAQDVVKKNFGKLVLMMLIVAVIPSVVIGLTSLIFNLCLPIPLTLMMSMPTSYLALFFGPSTVVAFIVYIVVITVVSALIAPALTLGMYSGILRLVRGEQTSVGVVFSRISSCLKGFLLSLFIGLRIWLWTLPGLGVITLGLFIGGSFGTILTIAGFILMYALIIPAVFRYCMSLPALADQPELGVLGSFRKSKEIMQGRKWQYFRLVFFYVLILLAFFIVLSVLAALLVKVPVLSFVVLLATLAVFLIVNMIIQVASLTFYGVYSGNN